MTNVMKNQKFENETDILISPELAFAIPCVVSNAGITANEDGRKIIKAGTPLTGDENPLKERETVLKAYTGEGTSSCYGYARWNIDVTDGDTNATILIDGYVDRLKLSGDVLSLISVLNTDSSATNYSRVRFINGRGETKSTSVITGDSFAKALQSGGNVIVAKNLTANEQIKASIDTHIDLNGKKLTMPQEEKPSAIWVKDYATLTVSGKGVLDSEGYGFEVGGAVLKPSGTSTGAHTSATLIIEDGDYTSNSASIVQVDYGTAYIKGGTFKLSDDAIGKGWAKYTLNCIDNQGGQIIVTGGKFYKFDPSKDNGTEVKVPSGYKVVKDNDWYTVVVE